ncbi:MAG: cytochrome c oxidase subunit 3 [Gemmatimonadetes bacterium]|jgi:cytochrome c oxidase subunit 3/cytochrome o ubiquinol oxidase subunit 3|nr:cytochrome c oxidase subunit 3 [Gemmatimonadota bacterium]
MSSATLAHDETHDAHEAHHTSFPIDNRKLAIWSFIGSECLFFATLISTFLIYKDNHPKGPGPKDIFEVGLVTGGTAVLLFSSFFVVMALNGAQEGNRKKMLGWLAATIGCGLFFMGMQVYEFSHFYHQGLGYTTNLFGTSFYTLTGFHGTHVAIGTLWLITVFKDAVKGNLPPAKALNLELAALYWHFVDVVWIIIFPVVYLMNMRG